MKKIICKSIALLVVVIGLVNYLVYLKTGQMPVKEFVSSARDFSWSLPDMPQISLPESIQKLGNSATDMLPENQTRIYKWTDAHGVVHYSEEPPLDIPAQEMLIDPNTNVVKGLAPEEFVKINPQNSLGGGAYLIGDDSAGEPGINTESPPLEQAIKAKELLEQRNQQQQKILDTL